MPEQNITHDIAPSPRYLRLFFFATGIIATIAYRIIFLLDPFWTKIVWYIGTVGFIIYFGHRWNVENKRADLVKNYNLTKAIESSSIQGDQKTALSYLIRTSLTSKARFNSAFICIASLVVLIASLIIDAWHALS